MSLHYAIPLPWHHAISMSRHRAITKSRHNIKTPCQDTMLRKGILFFTSLLCRIRRLETGEKKKPAQVERWTTNIHKFATRQISLWLFCFSRARGTTAPDFSFSFLFSFFFLLSFFLFPFLAGFVPGGKENRWRRGCKGWGGRIVVSTCREKSYCHCYCTKCYCQIWLTFLKAEGVTFP